MTVAGLLALGIRPEQRVAIASGTRIEWLYADLAVMCAGAATTAVYPSTGGDEVAFILSDSGSRIVFAEDDTQIDKLRAQRDHLPDLLRVVRRRPGCWTSSPHSASSTRSAWRMRSTSPSRVRAEPGVRHVVRLRLRSLQ